MHDAGGHVGDPQHILVRLGGQSQHEVELHRAVTAGEGGAAALEQVLQRDILIDDVPQPLRTRLRREGQAGLAALGQTLHQVHGKVIRPQGRQGQADVARITEGLQLIAKRRQGRIVAGGQAGERDLLIARVIAGMDAVIGAQVPAAVADGAVDVPRLTEAAAADAAAEQLQRHAVLHDLSAGHDGPHGKIGLVHIVDDALRNLGGRTAARDDGGHCAVVVVRHIVQAGNIDAVQLGGSPQELLLAPALSAGGAVQLHQLHGDVLPLAQADQVDEIRQRLGVVHGGAAGDHQRRQARAVRRVQGNAGQIQHIEDGGERHLVAHGKGHDIKIGNGITGFQRKQRHIRPPHLLLHVSPGGEDPFTPYAVHVVHDAVEDTHSQIGHPDLVGIGKAEGDTGIHLRLVLLHGVVFAAHIAGGLLHPWQDAFQSLIHGHSPCMYF